MRFNTLSDRFRTCALLALLVAVPIAALADEAATNSSSTVEQDPPLRVFVSSPSRYSPAVSAVPMPPSAEPKKVVAVPAPKSATADLVAANATNGYAFKVLDSLVINEGRDRETVMFLDKLYASSANSTVVNCYSGITIPDSFLIDLKGYVPPLESPRITSHYGWRWRRMHHGIDLALKTGTPIKSAFDGVVRISSYNRRGYGHYIVVRHNNGLETVYGHLSKRNVVKGDEVKAGDVIGLGGNTGRSTGPHLHFEARFVGQTINPAILFDFKNHVAHKDSYLFTKVKKKSYSGGSYSGSSIVYVRRGDNLGAIARRNRTTVTRLCQLNRIKSTTVLQIGQKIRVR